MISQKAFQLPAWIQFANLENLRDLQSYQTLNYPILKILLLRCQVLLKPRCFPFRQALGPSLIDFLKIHNASLNLTQLILHSKWRYFARKVVLSCFLKLPRQKIDQNCHLWISFQQEKSLILQSPTRLNSWARTTLLSGLVNFDLASLALTLYCFVDLVFLICGLHYLRNFPSLLHSVRLQNHSSPPSVLLSSLKKLLMPSSVLILPNYYPYLN